jgi:hypothetical protein
LFLLVYSAMLIYAINSTFISLLLLLLLSSSSQVTHAVIVEKKINTLNVFGQLIFIFLN